MSKNTSGTPEEQFIHKEAVRLRKMTDAQLVAFVRKAQTESTATEVSKRADNLPRFIKAIQAGECKGVKGATAYKLTEFAKQKGLLV